MEIEAQAKRRLADEYDAAQARGEVQTAGGARGNQHGGIVPDGNIATVTDLGLTRKQVHEARQLRDAEAAIRGRFAERVGDRERWEAECSSRVLHTIHCLNSAVGREKSNHP